MFDTGMLHNVVWIVYKVLTMHYEGYVEIMLAALGVMLMILTLFVAVVAVVGWSGMREAATKSAADAAERKMKDYPKPEHMQDLCTRVEAIIGSWEEMQNQIVNAVATKPVAPSSDTKVQSTETSVAPPYPGKGGQNVDTTPDNPGPHNSGPASDPSASAG